MATFAYEAAMAESRVPRKPIPTAPSELEQQQEEEKARKRQRAKERKAFSPLPADPAEILLDTLRVHAKVTLADPRL
jgi:hypothetical protein